MTDTAAVMDIRKFFKNRGKEERKAGRWRNGNEMERGMLRFNVLHCARC